MWNAVQTRTFGENTVAEALNEILPGVITRYNSEIAHEMLSRLPSEKLPEDPRAATAFRGRIGLLVEYAIVDVLAEVIGEDSGGALSVTFNTLNEFADLFIRDSEWTVQIRIDVKTLHDTSAEYSARYDALKAEIREYDDYLMFIAWQWQEVDHRGVRVIVPAIVDGLFIPAIEVAYERDRRQIMAGGSFDLETGVALAASGNRDTNFGKMARLVHPLRRNLPDLSPRMRKLLDLMEVQAEARRTEPSEIKVVLELADEAETTDPTMEE